MAPAFRNNPFVTPTTRSTSTLCILDRNAIITIANSRLLSPSSFNMIKLRSIDRTGNFISIIFSLFEGMNPYSTSLNREEISQCLSDEADKVNTFYKYARKDCDFIKPYIDTFHDHYLFETLPYACDFFVRISPSLFCDVKRSERLERITFLIEQACACGLPEANPTIFFAIAALYGDTRVRKILKFSRSYSHKDAYNAVSDIHLMLFIPLLMNLFSSTDFNAGHQFGFGNFNKIQLITFDKNLKNVFNTLLPLLKYPTEPITREWKFTFRDMRPLFTNVSDQDLKEIAKFFP